MGTSEVPEGSPHMSTVERFIGVGSSAGGLEALTELLSSLPPDLPFCYVIAQHTSPEHNSPLTELLAHSTRLPVHTATDGSPLEAGTVLVTPPDADIAVDGLRVRLSALRAPGSHPRIDDLLGSLADEHGANAIAIILSGAGSDGSEGVRRVHAAGGVVIVQDPRKAEFAAMPQSAIQTGCADLVVPATQIGEILRRLPSPSDEPPLTPLLGVI